MRRGLLLTVLLLLACFLLTGCYAGLSKDGMTALVLSEHAAMVRAIESGTVVQEWEGRQGILHVYVR